jgi:hypothetical protein
VWVSSSECDGCGEPVCVISVVHRDEATLEPGGLEFCFYSKSEFRVQGFLRGVIGFYTAFTAADVRWFHEAPRQPHEAISGGWKS